MDFEKYRSQIEDIVDRALDEDLSEGDITTDPLIPAHIQGTARFMVKQQGVIAGLFVAALVFKKVDPFLKFIQPVVDGTHVHPGDIVASVQGDVRSILKGERTALNFLQRLSGIATLTSTFVAAVKGLPVKILDTRKTTPGLRILEKFAVSAGGGTNHRYSLGDMVLIKDNHIAILRKRGFSIGDIVVEARRVTPKALKIEMETGNADDALAAAQAGADVVMLDNMSLKEMQKAVNMIGRTAIVEASGGVDLDTVQAVAETGVDWISIGALTHSARALDISMKLTS